VLERFAQAFTHGDGKGAAVAGKRALVVSYDWTKAASTLAEAS
jgi:hypothetical protein